MDLPIIFPAPKIKEEDDLSDIIDLDGDKTPEDLVYEWDAKVRLKIKNYFIVDSEQCLDTLMKWYIQSMKDEVVKFDDFPVLNVLIAKHIQFFKLYFVELNSCFVNNYLDNMEEILTFYSNIEIKSLPVKRKGGSRLAFKKLLVSMCQKIVSMLSLYLLNREERVYHVVMKIKLNLLPEDSKELLNLIYRKLLTKDPSDKSDLGFCRAYILYQKWKTVRKPEDWEKMDAVMYKLYDRTAESVKTNETLSQILLPQNNSLFDILIHISEKHVIITEEYFKFLKSRKTEEKSLILPELGDIEITDEMLPDLTDNNVDGDFDKEYQNFVKSMSTLSRERGDSAFDDCITVKLEDEDDDCQIVAVSSIGCESESTELVHEILEDENDGDIEEIIYFKKKEQQNVTQKDKEKSGLSFLDSIEITEPLHVPTEKVSSSSNTTFLPSKPSRNMVTTSTNTSPDSPNWNSSSRESAAQAANPNISTSNAPRRTEPDADYQRSSVSTSAINLEIDTERISSASKNSTDVTSAEALFMWRSVQIKNVVNMQTQTDTIHENVVDRNNYPYDDKEKLSSRMSDKRTGMGPIDFLYGLVTPPSDQPHDEHVSPTESNMYPNVYAKIVRTHNSPDETDNIAKISGYLPSSIAKVNLEQHSEPLPNSCETNESDRLVSPLPDQSTTVEDQCSLRQEDDSNTGSDMELEPNIEPNAKKKPDNFNKDVDSTGGYLNRCESDLGMLDVNEEKIMDGVDTEGQNQDAFKDLDGNVTTRNEESNFNNESYTSSRNSSDIVPLGSPTPSISIDVFKAPVASANSPCTSTDTITSCNYSNLVCVSLVNGQREVRNVSCPSPDITSTSTDIQDFHDNFSVQVSNSREDLVVYADFCCDVSETEDPYVDNQCLEKYVEYSECNGDNRDLKSNENVSQSNLDDGEEGEKLFIEDTVLMNNVEEVSYNIESANVNESSLHSDLSGAANNEGDQIVQPEVVNQVEKVNGEIVPPASLKELSVAVEKLHGGTEHKILDISKKIMYTSAEKVKKPLVDTFTIFQDSLHLNGFQTHDLDDIFSGPVSKVNGGSSFVNPDKSFDLFNSKASSISEANSPRTPTNSSGNSTGELLSPAYEGIDDFRNYFEENKNSNMLGLSPVHKFPPVDDKSRSSPTSLGNSLNHHKNKGKPSNLNVREMSLNHPASVVSRKSKTLKARALPNGRRTTRIAFTEHVIDTRDTVTHSPTENNNDVLQGILKKSSSNVKNYRENSNNTLLRIPSRMINLESVAYYGIKINDQHLQGFPFVLLEKLTESKIQEHMRINEFSRRVKLEKEQAQCALQSMSYRVDYDKSTMHVNENDMLSVSIPNFGEAKIPLNQLTSISSGVDKGMTAVTNYIDNFAPCEHSLPNINESHSFPLKSNSPAKVCQELNNSENFHTCKYVPVKDLNRSNFDSAIISNLKQELAIVPRVDNYEASSLPADLFPNPTFVNSFSLPATLPSHTFPTDSCPIETTLFSPASEGFDSKSSLYDGNAKCLNPSENSSNNAYVSIPIYEILTNDVSELNLSNVGNEINVNRATGATDAENNVQCEAKASKSSNGNDVANFDTSRSDEGETCMLLPFKKRKLAGKLQTSDLPSDVPPSEPPFNVPSIGESPTERGNGESTDAYFDSAEMAEFIKNIDKWVKKEDISYPATHMLSIADVQENFPEPYSRVFKTPAERKEMPPPPAPTYVDPSEGPKFVTEHYNNHSYAELKEMPPPLAPTYANHSKNPRIVGKYNNNAYAECKETPPPLAPTYANNTKNPKIVGQYKNPTYAECKETPPPLAPAFANPSENPKIVTEQYNNHTYNNPTINYHMNNVPYPFFTYGLPHFSPIILPMNSTTTFDVVNSQQPAQQQPATTGQAPVGRPKKERRSRRKKNVVF